LFLIDNLQLFSLQLALFPHDFFCCKGYLGLVVPLFKKIASEYFSFSKKERAGIITILLLILIFTTLPFFYPYFILEKKYDHAVFEKEIAGLKMKQQDSTENPAFKNPEDRYRSYYPSSEKKYYAAQPKAELFYFDPNTLSVDGWKKLGIKDKTVATIQNYISKGGRFKRPEDIGKIWGLHEDEVQRLVPYVSIQSVTSPVYAEKKIFENKAYNRPANKINTVDINSADTAAFIALPGIGSKLANRIVNFRDKLGGFYKVDQVSETFALPDSTFQKIKPYLVLSGVTVKKININRASAGEMKVHPYIRYNLAAAIVQYRSQHGDFKEVSDIKKIMMVTDDIYNKAAPYLSVQ
jgi:DNA uptake protein ComE-like DNA-binding protein